MDWILKHKDDPVEETKDDPMELEDGGEISAEIATAQSLKCDECQKLFKNAAAAEFHAVKSGHQSFSESTGKLLLRQILSSFFFYSCYKTINRRRKGGKVG